jgi:hypothetical protein
MPKFSQLIKKKEVWDVVYSLESVNIERYTLREYGNREFLKLDFEASAQTIYEYGHFRGALSKAKK